MKIYNEIISRFNELTGKWETISEDSFDYNGELAQLQQGQTNGGTNGGNVQPMPEPVPGGGDAGGALSLPSNATVFESNLFVVLSNVSAESVAVDT